MPALRAPVFARRCVVLTLAASATLCLSCSQPHEQDAHTKQHAQDFTRMSNDFFGGIPPKKTAAGSGPSRPGSEAPVPTPDAPPRRVDPPSTPPSLEEQARDAFWNTFSERVSVCGVSGYVWVRTMPTEDARYVRLYELEDPELWFQRIHTLSKADRLNGLEWSGLLVLYSQTFRYRNISPQADPGWRPWENGSKTQGSYPDFDFEYGRFFVGFGGTHVTKRDGRWDVDASSVIHEFPAPMDCKAIAALPN